MSPKGRRIALALVSAGLLIALWLLNVSRVGRPGGCPSGCATGRPRPGSTVRVMSLNLLHGFPRFEHLEERLDLVAEEIRRQEADIVLLQEVPWTPRLGNGAAYLAQQVGMNYLYLRANGNRLTILFEEGEAILSRYPLSEVSYAELVPRAGFFENRVALRATVQLPSEPVQLVVTHLTHGQPDVNRRQTLSLVAFVSARPELPTIVAGDFNAPPESPQIRMLNRLWVDAFRAADPEEEAPTCCVDGLTAGPDEHLEKRIDYVWLVPGVDTRLEVVEAKRVLDHPSIAGGGWLWASDHVGLLVVVELP